MPGLKTYDVTKIRVTVGGKEIVPVNDPAEVVFLGGPRDKRGKEVEVQDTAGHKMSIYGEIVQEAWDVFSVGHVMKLCVRPGGRAWRELRRIVAGEDIF